MRPAIADRSETIRERVRHLLRRGLPLPVSLARDSTELPRARLGDDAPGRGCAACPAGRARAAQPALVDGLVGLAWAPGGRPRVVFDFTTENGRIVAIDLIADPARLGELELELLNEEG
jgi:hypothetical protein